MDYYISDLETFREDSSHELNSWLLSIEKDSKLTGNNPKDICYIKADETILSLF